MRKTIQQQKKRIKYKLHPHEFTEKCIHIHIQVKRYKTSVNKHLHRCKQEYKKKKKGKRENITGVSYTNIVIKKKMNSHTRPQ